MRIVLDTNVVISALLWGGTPYRLIQAAAEGSLTLCTSKVLIAELREVLDREYLRARLGRHSRSLEQAISFYAELTISVSAVDVPRVVPADPDDDEVIAAAIDAKADLIVTGDRDLLSVGAHRGIRIVTPAEAVHLTTIS